MKHKRINILPPGMQVKIGIEITFWIRRLALLLIAILSVLVLFNNIQHKLYTILLGRERSRYSQLLEEKERLSPMVQRLKQVEKQVAGLKRCDQVLAGLTAEEYFRWSSVLNITGRLVPAGLWLTGVAFAQQPAAEQNSRGPDRTLGIYGQAVGYHAVASFITALEESPHFEAVKFQRAVVSPGSQVAEFYITGRVKSGGR